MPADAAIILALIILAASLVAVLALLSYRRRKAQDEGFRQAASALGWQFETVTEHGHFVRRWRGTTEGVPWTAESLRSVRRASKSRHRRRRAARWRTATGIGVTTPILCVGVPDGTEAPAVTVARGDGFLAQLARTSAGMALDMAVDMYFGEALGREVDAGAFSPVPGITLAGFIVMAENPNDAGRLLARGLHQALVEATSDRGSVLSEADRPWILITRSGVAIGRMEGFATAAALDRFVAAGVRLTRAATSGRPSPS